jgi:formylglycine-generating enzyme required for sulfatase activity
MRVFLSAVVALSCVAPLVAEANPYAAYVAKYVGEYALGKCLDEIWDAATGAPDVRELDLRLRAFENALSQVDARLGGRVAEMRRPIAKRPTRDEVRQIVLQVRGELESRIAELERRVDRIERKTAQFGLQPTHPKVRLLDDNLASLLWLWAVSTPLAKSSALDNTGLEFETNSIGIKLVLIQPGEFMMGSRDGDTDEKPPHKVKIAKPFYLGVTEVTQEQYERVMGTNPSEFKGDPRRPVESVSWEDAVEFCRKLTERERSSGKSGQTYRLPTEAEWEYACRAGTTTKWCCGDDESALADYAWYSVNAGEKTHAVAQKKPNAWGLYDMHGNVWEWCADWYGEDYYAASPREDPTGPAAGSRRVIRGGGWFRGAGLCRAAFRYSYGPAFRYDYLGFRLARTASSSSSSR